MARRRALEPEYRARLILFAQFLASGGVRRFSPAGTPPTTRARLLGMVAEGWLERGADGDTFRLLTPGEQSEEVWAARLARIIRREAQGRPALAAEVLPLLEAAQARGQSWERESRARARA